MIFSNPSPENPFSKPVWFEYVVVGPLVLMLIGPFALIVLNDLDAYIVKMCVGIWFITVFYCTIWGSYTFYLCQSKHYELLDRYGDCLLYTSPSPRDRTRSRMPSSA